MKKHKKEKKLSTKLRDKTLKLLKDRPASLTLMQISKDTGIEETWLKVFSAQRVEHPSVNRVETLYNYLSNSALSV